VALVTYVSAGSYDTMLGSASIITTLINVTNAGITSSGVTAPNTTNKITGCWINIGTAPTNGGNFVVEVLESGVVKATATINNADIQLGINYVRFATPYTFATLTASAYTVRVKNSVSSVNAGQVRSAASNLWFQLTYDTAAALGATDDVWVGGFHDSGMTTKTLTISGTSNSWGSAAATALGNVLVTQGAAIMIGAGGTFKFDTSASTTLTLNGSVFVNSPTALFDMRGSATKSIINTLIFTMAANGDQGLHSAYGTAGGQILTTGATYDIYTTYASGLGTAASPLITNIAWDADMGDEIVIGGGTDYLKNETRYIKTRNSSTSFVLSSTPGGAEAALVNTHAAGSHIANLTRNVIIKPSNTARGWYAYHASSTTSNMNYTRMEYSDCSSGRAVAPTMNSSSSFDGIVFYHNSIAGRQTLVLRADATAQTHNGITLYNTQGGNYTGQSGIGYSGTSNKTLTNSFHFNAPSGTASCAFISLNVSSTSNTITNCHSYGANAINTSFGYGIGIFSSNANTFNNCSINGARQNAFYSSTASGNTFNNCNFGTIASNSNDIFTATSTLNQAYFNACSFGSTTLISNYLNQLDTSLIKFQDMDGNTSKHRWYTNYGSWWSAGSGLTDTTVRTASSLSLVSKPENATTGSSWTFKIPANPTSQVGIFGYIYRNATFSSGTLKVELFLPGTLLTATPDATYTFPTTTGSWLPFNISAYYSGSVARYAQVRITGVTATAGAYFFVDDLYDAGTGNKVAGFDLWDEGQPSQIMVQSDFSVVPSAVWAYSDSNTQTGTMGKIQSDSNLTNVLAMDKLS